MFGLGVTGVVCAYSHDLAPYLFLLSSCQQFLNFALVPLYLRTAFTGCCAFVWATFLCYSQQSGDGTATVALAVLLSPTKRLQARESSQEK